MSFQRGAFQSLGFQAGGNWGIGSGCVLSDVLIEAADMDLTKFQGIFAREVPTSFSALTPFMPGDYEYSTAMIKGVMTADGIQVTRLPSLRFEADLPDIIKQGSTVVPGTGFADVTFASPFNAEPEIIVSMKSGTEFIKPRVENVTKTGFRIILRNASDAVVSGTVSWVAHGY